LSKLLGKSAIVTGGASGLGRAVAEKLADNGANVAILDIDLENAQKTAFEIKQAVNSQIIPIQCDVTKEESVKRAFVEVMSSFKRLDVLHVNAGIIDQPRKIVNMDLNDWNKIISVNLTGAFLTAKYGIMQMLNQIEGGAIVFTGSNWAFVCDPGFSSYAASKGGVVSFARALALDHAPDKIRINVVCPGNIHTPLLDRQLSLEQNPEETLRKMGQISTPEEIANVVLFLVSDDSSAMKGSVVIADQGETLQYGPGLQARK